MLVAAAKSALSLNLDGLRRSVLWLDGYTGLVIAVSGGADSLALALVAAEICAEQNIKIEAVVVDHGLRAEAETEADNVVKLLKSRGICSSCLKIALPAPTSGKPAWARKHRLDLLCDYARQKASAVLFAHHYDDQAETVAMRLARGSAITGLSAIAPVRIYQGVLFARPFLGLRKSDLIAVCKAYGVDYITDPSNTDQAFERARMRTWLQRPGQSDLQQRLVQLATLSARLSAKMAEARDKWCAEHIVFTFRLRAHINLLAFQALDKKGQNFILRHCLAVIGGQPYPVADDKLNRIQTRLATGVRSTAGGCFIQATAEHIEVLAEFGRLPEPELTVQSGRVYQFDRRWLITSAWEGVIRRMGPAEWAQHSKFYDFAHMSDWTARMGAMIPLLHGLDGRLYRPHLETYTGVYTAASQVSAKQEQDRKAKFTAAPLPLDGPVERIKQSKMTDKGEYA